ncbi:trans-resveratrol di-O-methyltransferase-like isoform X2 [Iris pallida]|uniref:Trans-resveratrol di-O-methyltransferase-like isoform X2 n=1 Tax=Iris pallida TaxID=29817 RepID=A0AAX6HTI6_IRIPA|nr:trans-resveratrol di-O-methyltransferase-like isoform X2 [Iris pallida]
MRPNRSMFVDQTAAGSTTTEGASSKELLEAQSHLWLHIFSFINSLSLKTAVELGIPDAVHSHGKPITLTELATKLSIPPIRIPNFQRFMTLLVHNGFFTVTSTGDEDAYEITTNSIPLIKEKGACITPFIELMLDESLLFPWQSLSSWFKTEEPSTAFEKAHGKFIWEATGTMPEFGKLIREGLGSDSASITKVLIEDCGNQFVGVKTLVEVAGGTGTMALAIADAFPDVKCTVFDLPHMIEALEKSDKVAYVGGDMFERIPPADLLILKWVLHGWSDEHCVKILKNCKEAIPTKENGGKAIIIDKVMDTSDGVHPKLTETQLHFDIHMMVHTTGKQRTEAEWKTLFDAAGFKEYKILPALGLRSIIEIYH